jgi:hypothetical protein
VLKTGKQAVVRSGICDKYNVGSLSLCAALVADLRHYSLAALEDVLEALPQTFVNSNPAQVPRPDNLDRFIARWALFIDFVVGSLKYGSF